MSAPARLAPAPRRTAFALDDPRELSACYETGSPRRYATRTPVDALAQDAVLVSSETDVEVHAPIVDLDLPVQLGLDPAGGYVLWVDGLDRTSWRSASATLEAAGLGAPLDHLTGLAGGGLAQTTDRVALRHRPGWEPVCFADVHQTLRILGPSWDGTWADLVDSVNATVHTGAPRGVRTASPVPLADPWPLPLSVPALLLPSTHHHHLYLEHLVDFDTLAMLLRGLARADVVEDGFYSATMSRGRAFARLPWIRKPGTPDEGTDDAWSQVA